MSEKKKTSKKQMTREAAVAKLWEAGKLSWKLKGKQKDIYNHFNNTEDDISACLISRRFGKSFTLCLMAMELCLSKPRSTIKYACPTQKQVEVTIRPIIIKLLEDCPEHLKCEWRTQSKSWVFPNGSEIQIAGTDGGNYNSLRGGAADLCIADEAAFMDELETVIYSVLAPTTDTTDGKILLATTPNDKDPNHEFHEHFLHPMEAAGKLLKFTYEDSPMIDEKKKVRIISRYPGGIKNIKFRCEYLCEIPNVTESSVIPEFVEVQDKVVKEMPLPEDCDFYTSMDLGFHDLTVALFGYYNSNSGQLVILDEYIVNGTETKTDILDKNIRLKESLHFMTKSGEQEAYLRVMDNNNLMLTNEISTRYGLRFIPTQKHKKEQAVDNVRMWIEQERIIIHPRCKNLLYHVKYAQWHITRSGTHTGNFKILKGNESAGLLTSHADALDALIYMVRNIHTYRKHYVSADHQENNEDSHFARNYKKQESSQAVEFMQNVLNLTKK